MCYIIVDLEATYWEDVRGSPSTETIEIGAVALATAAEPQAGEFSAFVRPVAVRQLGAFCQRLTSIRQEDVDAAESFWQVLPRLTEWIGPEPYRLCSWGAYDLGQLRQDCQRQGLELLPAFERGHVNMKTGFARVFGVRSCGMVKALEIAGLPLEGTRVGKYPP